MTPPHSDDSLGQYCEAALVELPAPIILSDYETLLFANHSAVRMLRASSRAQVEGLSAAAILHPDMHAAAGERRGLILDRGQTLSGIPIKLCALDGTTVVVSADAHPVVFGDAKVAMFLYRIGAQS